MILFFNLIRNKIINKNKKNRNNIIKYNYFLNDTVLRYFKKFSVN